MRKIDLNELSQWSPWPSRLLGLTEWNVQSRTIKKIDQEYDKNKYAKCLAYYTENGGLVSPEEIKQFELKLALEETVCVSYGDDLVLTSLGEVRSKLYQLLAEKMRSKIDQSTTVVELGCGYGYNLWTLRQHFPDKFFLGGELSANAIRLASELFQKVPKFKVEHLNLYDPIYGCLDSVQPPITIFTSHAIEQLHESKPVFEALMRHREKILTVFNFEPVYELHDTTLLGLMRRRYIEINDYNRDLLSEIKSRSDHVRIINVETNILGLNPLNPLSIVQWEFAK